MRTTAALHRTVGLAGLGAIGSEVARTLDAGLPGLSLAYVANTRPDKAAAFLSDFRHKPEMVVLEDLAAADIVLEALPAAAFESVAAPVIAAGKILVCCSAGALLSRPHLLKRAGETGAQVLVPTGAIAGLDAIRSVAQEPVDSILLESRKPPSGFAGNAYVAAQGIDLETLDEARLLFEGSAAEAVERFPANANVAAALALAGIGAERTRVQIWADPATRRNLHTIHVEARSTRMTLAIENIPSPDNPRTSRLAVLSVLSCLRQLGSPIRVGS